MSYEERERIRSRASNRLGITFSSDVLRLLDEIARLEAAVKIQEAR